MKLAKPSNINGMLLRFCPTVKANMGKERSGRVPFENHTQTWQWAQDTCEYLIYRVNVSATG